MPTRDEIITALAAQRQRVEDWFRALSDAAMEREVTESEIPGAAMWTPKDHLAHMLGVERFFQGAIKRALDGADDPLGFFTQTGSDDPEAHSDLINQANERGASKYRAEPAASLLARFAEARQTTLALLDSLDDARLEQPVAHSPFGADTTIGSLFKIIATHGVMHIRWLNTAIAGRGAQSE
jgi:uncharacterized damage-inducible protein DinB